MRLQLPHPVNILNFVGNLERMIGSVPNRFYGTAGPSSEFPIIIGVDGNYPANPAVIYAVIVHDAPNWRVPYQGEAKKFDILVGDRTNEIVKLLIGIYFNEGG